MWSVPFSTRPLGLSSFCAPHNKTSFRRRSSIPHREGHALDAYCALQHKRVRCANEPLVSGRTETSMSNTQTIQAASELRALAEKSVEQARGAFGTLIANARKASTAVQSS